MVQVAWWPEQLSTFVGGERLGNLRVYYDFSWYDVFGHGRATFPHGQSLGLLIRRDCPKGLTPVLFLTESRDAVEPWIEPGDGTLVVVVPIYDYLAHSDPDPAASYYAQRFGPGLTSAKNADWLATQAAVVEAVVRLGLTIDDIKAWAAIDPERFEQLRSFTGSDGSVEQATPAQALEVLRSIEGVSEPVLDGLAVLLGQAGDDAAARLQFLDALVRAALEDEDARAAFLRNNREFVATILHSAADAPDIVALAARREVLEEFERLLRDDDYFDQAMKAGSGKPEDVWRVFLEENPWIIGSTLAPQFLHSWSKERLEQTVVGSSIAGPGKRPDAVLRTAGAISAVVLAEIKHHRTRLLGREYRPGCWRVGGEVAGGVAQCQGTVDEAQDFLGKSIDLTSDEGYVVGQAFICRPRSLLVLGSLDEFTKDGSVHPAKFESFERFRRSIRDPEILTFDELFERAQLRLWEQYTEAGGELWLCPICLASRDLAEAERVGYTEVVGATPMWEWAGSDATVFSY